MPDGAEFDYAVRDALLRKLRVDIGQLDRHSSEDSIAAIIDRIARGDFDEITSERLLETVKQQTATPIFTLRKQFRKAKTEAQRKRHYSGDVAGIISEFNKQYAVVNEAGKPWVMQWRRDPVLGREVLERSSFRDFRDLHLNRQINGATAAEIWLEHPDRRQFLAGVTFDPTGQSPSTYWNLWRGFPVPAEPGDWGLLRHHIEHVICDGNDIHADYVLNWLARSVQHPETQGEVAIVLRGGKGVGKGILGRWAWRLFGQHGMQISDPNHLVGRFNAHLRDCILLFADEAFYAGDKQHEGVLKGLITEPTLVIEGKFQNAVVVPNRLHVIMASNSKWVIPASADERRYFVLDVSDARRGDVAYFAAIEDQMKDGGFAAMLHDLLARDMTTFEVRDVPKTAGLRVQKALSLDSLESWWKGVLERGYVYTSRHGAPIFGEWHEFASTQLLYSSYLQWCDKTGRNSRSTQVELGIFMTKLYQKKRPDGRQAIGEIDNPDRELLRAGKSLDDVCAVLKDRPPGYQVGSLKDARQRFLKDYDISVEWEQSE